jgi:nicotinate-nucleotide adenylyltransferase
MQKIAIFGGTFNPIHHGHLTIAAVAQAQFALDQVLWVPSQPHYKPGKILDLSHRQAMIERAIAPYPPFVLSRSPEKPYAIDTLLAQQMDSFDSPDRQWFWIVGLDAFRLLPRWHRSPELATRCTWLVAPRGNESVEGIAEIFAQQGIHLAWQLLDMPPVEISSSLVRQACWEGRSIHPHVPDSVATYIFEQGLYAAPA